MTLALCVVSHRGDDEIHAAVGQHRDPGRRFDFGEGDIDAELVRNGPRHIDLITLPRLSNAGAEQRIVVAHPDADLAGAEDADQPVMPGCVQVPGAAAASRAASSIRANAASGE